jgi:hypothetical protein
MVMIYDGDARGEHWECQPSGVELVACTSGLFTVVRETEAVDLGRGEATDYPAGAGLVADHDGRARLVTPTAGVGTEHRAR